MVVRFKRKRMFYSLAAALAGVSLVAGAAGNVVGDVVASDRASVNGILVPGEWTIASGDALSTAAGGSALVHLSTEGEARLAESTSVVFEREAKLITAHMSSGTLGVAVRGEDDLMSKTDQFAVQPARPGNAEYTVAMLPGRSVISAERGDIRVTEAKSGIEHIVPQGHYGTISQATTSNPGGSPTGTQTASTAASHGLLHSGPLLFAVAVGGGVGVALAIHGAMGSSPASPSQP
jgi:hypothetical protein